MGTLWHSLQSAAMGTFFMAAIAFLAALWRFSAGRAWRIVLDVLFLLPLAIPIPLAIAMVIHCPDIWLDDSIAALPLFYLCAIMGWRRVNHECIDAARLQGCGSLGVFWHLFLPPAWPWLVAGVALGFLRSAILVLISYSDIA